jgi:hypothetical protein
VTKIHGISRNSVAGGTVGARDRYFEVSHFRQSRCVRVNSGDDLVGRVGTSISENAHWLTLSPSFLFVSERSSSRGVQPRGPSNCTIRNSCSGS